jgi:2-C-methyl-D-erythritol 4-phosphate cytidylyltransferase
MISKWIGEIIMTVMKTMTITKAIGLFATGEVLKNVVEEAADRAESVADLLEEIERSIKEKKDDNIPL